VENSIRKTASVFLVASFTVGLMLAGSQAGWAQQPAGGVKEQLVGTWIMVSNDTIFPDGKRIHTFGPNPQGMLIFDAGGRYSLQACRPDRPKFASNQRDKGTPEENQAVVQGCNPHWGKYTVDEKDRVINFQIEHALFPNWEGIQQKRPFTITGDELKYAVPAANTGGVSEVVWKRAR
jgi:hypothetical protein